MHSRSQSISRNSTKSQRILPVSSRDNAGGGGGGPRTGTGSPRYNAKRRSSVQLPTSSSAAAAAAAAAAGTGRFSRRALANSNGAGGGLRDSSLSLRPSSRSGASPSSNSPLPSPRKDLIIMLGAENQRLKEENARLQMETAQARSQVESRVQDSVACAERLAAIRYEETLRTAKIEQEQAIRKSMEARVAKEMQELTQEKIQLKDKLQKAKQEQKRQNAELMDLRALQQEMLAERQKTEDQKKRLAVRVLQGKHVSRDLAAFKLLLRYSTISAYVRHFRTRRKLRHMLDTIISIIELCFEHEDTREHALRFPDLRGWWEDLSELKKRLKMVMNTQNVLDEVGFGIQCCREAVMFALQQKTQYRSNVDALFARNADLVADAVSCRKKLDKTKKKLTTVKSQLGQLEKEASTLRAKLHASESRRRKMMQGKGGVSGFGSSAGRIGAFGVSTNGATIIPPNDEKESEIPSRNQSRGAGSSSLRRSPQRSSARDSGDTNPVSARSARPITAPSDLTRDNNSLQPRGDFDSGGVDRRGRNTTGSWQAHLGGNGLPLISPLDSKNGPGYERSHIHDGKSPYVRSASRAPASSPYSAYRIPNLRGPSKGGLQRHHKSRQSKPSRAGTSRVVFAPPSKSRRANAAPVDLLEAESMNGKDNRASEALPQDVDGRDADAAPAAAAVASSEEL